MDPIDIPAEEYKIYPVHSLSELKITWKDWLKVVMGKRPWVSLCFGVRVFTDDKGALNHLSVDMETIVTKVVVKGTDEEVETVKPRFGDDLHN